eukprot:5430550-Prymnesium_polylepis.1
MEVDRPLGGVRHHGVALPRRCNRRDHRLLLRGGACLPHAHDGRALELAKRVRGWAVPPTATATAFAAALASGA